MKEGKHKIQTMSYLDYLKNKFGYIKIILYICIN